MHRIKKTYRSSGLVLLISLVAVMLLKGCGTNIFTSMGDKKEKKAQLEEAKIKLDHKEYDAAAGLLDPLVADSSTDSNTARLYLAAAKIGQAGMDIWSILSTILDAADDKTADYSSLFEDATEKLLGEGAVRTSRMSYLTNAIEILLAAPDTSASRLQNTTCFLGAMLIAAELINAQSKITDLNTALTNLSGLSGDAVCTSLTTLVSAFDAMATTASSFTMVNRIISACPFLQEGEAAQSISGITSQLEAIVTKVDKGCSNVPTCTLPAALCNVLMPSCVQDALGVGSDTAVSGDSKVATCELALQCTIGGGCF